MTKKPNHGFKSWEETAGSSEEGQAVANDAALGAQVSPYPAQMPASPRKPPLKDHGRRIGDAREAVRAWKKTGPHQRRAQWRRWRQAASPNEGAPPSVPNAPQPIRVDRGRNGGPLPPKLFVFQLGYCLQFEPCTHHAGPGGGRRWAHPLFIESNARQVEHLFLKPTGCRSRDVGGGGFGCSHRRGDCPGSKSDRFSHCRSQNLSESELAAAHLRSMRMPIAPWRRWIPKSMQHWPV